MRKVRVRRWFTDQSVDDFTEGVADPWEEMPLVELYLRYPMLRLNMRWLPPLFWLNSLLEKGRLDFRVRAPREVLMPMGACGGLEWDPLQLDEAERAELATALHRHCPDAVDGEPLPDWAGTDEGWSIFLEAQRHQWDPALIRERRALQVELNCAMAEAHDGPEHRRLAKRQTLFPARVEAQLAGDLELVAEIDRVVADETLTWQSAEVNHAQRRQLEQNMERTFGETIRPSMMLMALDNMAKFAKLLAENPARADSWVAGRRLLIHAVDLAKPEAVELLLASKAHPDFVDWITGETPFTLAVKDRPAAVALALLKGGANPWFRNQNGETPEALIQKFGPLEG